jgi:carotenoid cleavage dioxygenase
MLRGNWSPVQDESSGLRAEVVAGAIPADFPAGYLVQNGPNPRWVRPSAGYHPFEGDGMLHSVEFAASRPHFARYSNSWVRTAKWHAENAAQRPLASGLFGDSPVRPGVHAAINAISLVGAMPQILMDGNTLTSGSGTANTSVMKHAGRVLALQEGSQPIVVDMPRLSTVGPLEGTKAFTAHPKVCPVTGELMWFNYGSSAGLSYGVWDDRGHPVHETTIHLPHNVMMHDIAVTRHCTVLLDCPLLLAPDPMGGHGPVHLNKDIPMRIGVLPRHGHGTEVEWYEVPGPGKMCFHVMNAYECSSGDIVLVGCAQPDVSVWDMNVGHAQQEKLTEWRVDRRSRQVTERVVSDVPCDFPSVSRRVVGLPFRYGYAAAFDPRLASGGTLRFAGITKHDVQAAETITWQAGDGVFVGEPAYVPRAGGPDDDEDDGYVLTFSRDERRGSSQVLMFDSKNFGAPPICRIQLPRRVPYGFHVSWVPVDD